VVPGRAQNRLECLQLGDDDRGVVHLVRVSLDVRLDRTDDRKSARGLEPATARAARGGSVELHVLGECFRLRVAEGDELPEAAQVLLVGDGVDGVSLSGERSSVEAPGIDSLDVPLEDDDEAEAQFDPQICPRTRSKFPPSTSSTSRSP
jgi:hypothetical protein